ncbi:MAG: hypothetical protein EZS28_049877, partial [Streblomastix strix]
MPYLQLKRRENLENFPLEQPATHHSKIKHTTGPKSQHRAGIKVREKANQQRQQLLDSNPDYNNRDIDNPDNQQAVKQPSVVQPAASESLALVAGQASGLGLISPSNGQKAVIQLNQRDEDESAEDEQTDEAALNQNMEYRVNQISQRPDQQLNLLTQQQQQNIKDGMEIDPEEHQDADESLNQRLHLRPRQRGGREGKNPKALQPGTSFQLVLRLALQPRKVKPLPAQAAKQKANPSLKLRNQIQKTVKTRRTRFRIPERIDTHQAKEIRIEIPIEGNGDWECADDN